MTYIEFLDYIKENIMEELEFDETFSGADVSLTTVTKNNGVTFDGINITKKDKPMSPTIYLNSYYDEYLSGKSLKEILLDIAGIRLGNEDKLNIEVNNILNFEDIKKDIVIRLVNYEKNREQLKKCPYLLFNDLAITFRWLAHQDSKGIASSLITNDEFKQWNISIDRLYDIALINTRTRFPYKLDSMRNLFKDFFEGIDIDDIEDNEVELYVLTNEAGINGASCILYEGVIEEFAKEMESDIYILPSSIHEVILLRDDGRSTSELKELVREANTTVVGIMDILSDTVYRYDRCKNAIDVA